MFLSIEALSTVKLCKVNEDNMHEAVLTNYADIINQ
jgi:hypothetical protein